MDFDRFMTWRRHFAVCEMAAAPIKPTTCHRVFAELVEEGAAHVDEEGYHRLYPDVDVEMHRRAARRIMNELVTDNQRLVRKLVSQLSKRSTAFLEEEDLFQAGLMALMRALEKFDPDRFSDKKRGASFASYLRHWVRHYMQISTADQQTIKHPRNFGMPFPIHKRMEDILQKTGLRATPEQLGTWKDGKKERPVTQELLDGWAAAGNAIVSLDSGSPNIWNGRKSVNYVEGPGNDPGLNNELPDSSKSPESLLTRAQLGQKAEAIVASFDEKDRRLVEEIREGVHNHVTAKRLGVTDEYARVLRRDIIIKLTKMVGKVA